MLGQMAWAAVNGVLAFNTSGHVRQVGECQTRASYMGPIGVYRDHNIINTTYTLIARYAGPGRHGLM